MYSSLPTQTLVFPELLINLGQKTFSPCVFVEGQVFIMKSSPSHWDLLQKARKRRFR